jgi:hypothetical protein
MPVNQEILWDQDPDPMLWPAQIAVFSNGHNRNEYLNNVNPKWTNPGLFNGGFPL